MNWLTSILGGLIASLVAIIVWEKYRQPKLIVEIHPERPAIQTLPGGARRAFYHLFVKNIGKSPAYYCKIFMWFFDEQGIRQVIPDVISGKWDRGPEPIIYVPSPGHGINGQLAMIEARQSFLIPFAEVLDIHHNVPAEGFCPVIKYENETECYAFSAWSYLRGQAPGHKVPEWKISPGKYIIEVELVYSGKKSQKERFLLENNSTAADGIELKKKQENRFTILWNKYRSLPFIILAVIDLGLILYFVTKFAQIKLLEKAAFVTQGIAGTIALAIPFLETTKPWVKIALTTAIELFIAGLFFQVINLIQKPHF